MLVRVHSECLTGDVFHSLRCDCGAQLESALAMIEREGCGVPPIATDEPGLGASSFRPDPGVLPGQVVAVLPADSLDAGDGWSGAGS